MCVALTPSAASASQHIARSLTNAVLGNEPLNHYIVDSQRRLQMPFKFYKGRTDKFEKTGHEYANCEVADCNRAGAFRCEHDHYICPPHVIHDETAAKMGRRCPICKAEILEKVQPV